MAINLGSEVLVTTNPNSYVVDDSYVRGGYRVVTTSAAVWAAASGVTDPNYQTELQNKAIANSEASIKTGCLLFDTTAGAYFRCTATNPAVTFVESFTGNSSLDPALYVQRTELPTDAGGGIDIASEATLQDALLSSIRVSTDGLQTTNLNVATSAVPGNTTDALIVNATSAVPATDTAATVTIILNLNAIGGDAGSA